MNPHRIKSLLSTGFIALALVFTAIERTDGADKDSTSQPAAPAIAVLNNRPVVVFRSSLFGHPPMERAVAAEKRIKELIAKSDDPKVATSRIPEGVVVEIDKAPAILIRPDDLAPLFGDTEEAVLARATRAIELAIAERKEARSLKTMVRAGLYCLLASLVFGVVNWLLHLGVKWVRLHLGRLQERWGGKIKLSGFSMFEQTASIVLWSLKLVRLAVILFLTYSWVAFCLNQFPHTRPWGESLGHYLFSSLETIGEAALDWIPNAIVIIVILLIVRVLTKLCRMFFLSVESGRVSPPWLHPEVARPTSRLVQVVIWLFALIMLYPNLPGSDTAAFKGVSVLLGVIISLGSTSVINQAASGLVLMYSRAFRPEDFVRIGDIEGTVVSLGILSTRLRTASREEVTIPNAVIVGGTTRNFSKQQRLPTGSPGAALSTSVTIGYSEPWRKIHELLLMAAQRTPGLEKDPPPFVLQKSLSDYYVEYQLNAVAETAQNRNAVLSSLHANVQDVFNEYGVQIMSPHYASDPPEKVWVPKEKWYEAPARQAQTTAIVEESTS
jgi:small-conductance mechanosensitive channel